ncbi:MAG: type II secretion system GspH family protein [Nitrospirota bacterium]|nr:type II secretion system GspH family protein [Nitrospirota bacterium]
MAGRKLYAYDCGDKRTMMNRKQAGFTLVELMVTMVIFVLVIVAASNLFTGLLNQFKQQSKIAESNIEGIIGLQMLRSDIEQAGYGLPYDLDGATYSEAVDDGTTPYDDSSFNDATGNPPRAIVASNDNGFNSSDVLVVKAANVGINAAAHKWAYIANTGANNIMRSWTNSDGASIADENLENGDRVIALRPVSGTNVKALVNGGGTFYTQYNSSLASFSDSFEPVANSYETYIVYGINRTTDPRMPFNRADYYVRRPATPPQRCAPGTGNLYKATVNQSDGGLTELPLLDCVADMQIVLSLDMDEDGAAGTFAAPAASLMNSSEGVTAASVQQTLADASLLRKRLKGIRAYILAHEGQRDTFYTYPNATINLADQDLGVLKTFDLNAVIGSTYINYRWKVYTMLVQPFNLR